MKVSLRGEQINKIKHKITIQSKYLSTEWTGITQHFA
jgi:hypothetical protein